MFSSECDVSWKARAEASKWAWAGGHGCVGGHIDACVAVGGGSTAGGDGGNR